MFNKTFVFPQTRTEYVPYEKTVVEKRAPTDESIKLYEEMKEKAYSSILGTIELRDNMLNVNSILYEEYNSMDKVCKYRLMLNGREITGEIKSSMLDLKDKQSIVRKIVDDASRHIAIEIVKGLEG